MNHGDDTERYSGLNLPDLMALMHDVVYPDPVSLVPETIGWKLMGLWVLVCLAMVAIDQVRRYRANRYRREAIHLIKKIERQNGDAAQQIATLVKRTAIAAFPRSEVASLTGTEWQSFLLQTSNAQLSREESEILARAAYKPGIEDSDVRDAALRWIRLHHV